MPMRDKVLAVDPPLSCYSLYEGLPEAELIHLAPLLVRVDLRQSLQRQWLCSLVEHLQRREVLLALVSSWPFPTLAHHLGRCLHAWNGGYPGLLRYYDPRLFGAMMEMLLPEQRRPWLTPAVLWSWLDRDAQPQRLMGESERGMPEVDFPPTELTDSQLEIIGCLADAITALENWTTGWPEQWSTQRRLQFCHAAMLQATEAGLLMPEAREAFLLEQRSNV